MTINDELFALRIALQDSFEDESMIIREIKKHLINISTPPSDIDKIIIDFYDSFGISFDQEFISSIQVQTFTTNQFASILLNNLQVPNLDISGIEEGDESLESDDLDDSDENLLEEAEAEVEANAEEVDVSANIDPTENIQTDFLLNHILSRSPFRAPGMPFQSFHHNGQIFNAFNQILSNINMPLENEDVKVTLEDEDIEKIDTIILDKDLDRKCSVCMMDFKKGDELSVLKCKHEFHKGCIVQWLKNYNYRCPVCRVETGKAKYNV